MNRFLRFLKLKKISLSNFWVSNGIGLLCIAVIGNHLTDRDNFPFNEGYSFPWIQMLISFAIGSMIIIIAYFNFQHFRERFFNTRINTSILLRFLLTTLGYVTIGYIVLYTVFVWFIEGRDGLSLFSGLTGLMVTLLLSAVGISLSFSNQIYQIHKQNAVTGTFKVQHGGKITPILHKEIAYLYSAQKIVYLVKTDGIVITTDFTLNDIESEMGTLDFFRANRQNIVHARSIEEVTAIENGKLSALLKPAISGEERSKINISRYKKQAFKDWLESNL